MDKTNQLIEAMLLDSELVIRVELASVALATREWSEMRVGDVLETGVSLRRPATLRISGREAARGELVNVDGRLGIRLTEIFDSD